MPRTHNRHFNLPLPHFKFDLKKSKNLKLLYAIRVLRDIINKLALFFLPIFLFQQGAESEFWSFLPGTPFHKGILLMAIYFAWLRLWVILSAMPAGKILSKVGIGRSFLVAHLLYGLFLIFLTKGVEVGWFLLLAAVADGIQVNFFWPGFHTLLARLAKRKHMGQDLGLLHFFLRFVAMVSPALGGLIAILFGFQTLFSVGLVGVLLGCIVSLLMDLKPERDKTSWKEFRSWLKEKSFVKLTASIAGRYVHDATMAIWPLYVFILLGTVDRVGLLYSFSLFLAMLFSFLIGFYIDHSKTKKPFFASGGILAVLWFFRLQVVNFWQIAIVDTIEKLTANFHWLYYDSVLMKRGKGSQALSYFLYREVIISVSAIVFWSTIIVLFLIFPIEWKGLFLLAAVGVLLSTLISERVQEKR